MINKPAWLQGWIWAIQDLWPWRFKSCKLELKLQDCWIGVFWRVSDWEPVQNDPIPSDLDVWICIVPMIPIHIRFQSR